MLIRISLFLALLPALASAEELSLSEFLSKAWESSPVAKGEAFQSDASEELIKSARGKYLPHVSLDAIDSTGFPASNSALHVGGLMGSPFRSGLAGGVVVEQTIYDFGRISSALEQAKASRSLDEARLTQEKLRFLVSLGKMYLACARTRSLQERDEQLMRWAEINLKETERYTKTGQRSIVDNSLVKTEVNNLKLDIDQLQKYQRSLLEQMRAYGPTSGCQPLSVAWRSEVPGGLRVEDPTILLAKAEIELAQASLEAAKAAQRPSLTATGSAGEMDQARLVKKKDYAVGVGLTFPIWNGGEDAHREQAFRSRADYQTQQLEAASLDYKTRLKNLEDEYTRDKDALKVLEENLEQVRRTMKLASDRYRRLEGPLVDVREAFKQLSAMEFERVQMMHTLGEVSLELGMLKRTAEKGSLPGAAAQEKASAHSGRISAKRRLSEFSTNSLKP